MSRKINLSDHATRREMAEKVRTLRVDRGLSQQELANLVEVSRQSIVDIENGNKVPRAKTLKKILTVLGVEVEAVEFNEQTEKWLVMFGTFIEAIPEVKRADAVQRALGSLAAEVGASNVSGSVEDVDPHEIDLSKGDLALAASTDGSTVQDQRHLNDEDISQDPEDKENQ